MCISKNIFSWTTIVIQSELTELLKKVQIYLISCRV